MDNIWDVVIIGSGPASLTAATYTTRGAASTLILGGEKWGGQLMLTTMVENFPGFPDGVQGPDLMYAMRRQAEHFGAKIVERNVSHIDTSKKPFEITADGVIYKAKSVLIATGATTRWLDVPGEKELIGRGVSSCAPCDAPFFKERNVAVVGGGDSAMEEALVLSKYANEVTIIHRRDSFRASAAMQEKVLKNPKIKIVWNTEVTQVNGTGKVEELLLRNVTNNETSKIAIDGVFVAVGHEPESKVFVGAIDLDEKGYVKLKPNDQWQMTTSVSGIFVAGDVHDYHYKQAITAAGFGCMAALEILKYLDEITG